MTCDYSPTITIRPANQLSYFFSTSVEYPAMGVARYC